MTAPGGVRALYEATLVERGYRSVIRLARRNAEPVDAGVDHQMTAPSPARRPQRRLLQRVDHRHRPNRAGIGAFRLILHAMQNRHLLRRDMGDHGFNLAPMGDEERLAPGIAQHRDAGRSAKPIGIRLDRRPRICRSRKRIKRAPIGGERIFIDGQSQAGRRQGHAAISALAARGIVSHQQNLAAGRSECPTMPR